MVRDPIQKWAHTQLVQEHSATVTSACSATVDWSRHKEWNKRAWANLHFKKINAGGAWIIEHSPKILANEKKKNATTTTTPSLSYTIKRWFISPSIFSAASTATVITLGSLSHCPQHRSLHVSTRLEKEMKLNEPGRQMFEKQNSWQCVKHKKLYSDLHQA